MKIGRKFPPQVRAPQHRPGPHPTRPQGPGILQPKVTAAPRVPPAAPPAYNPCPTPKVLQAKASLPQPPVAPHRPQPTPRALQTKSVAAPLAARPSALPAQRPCAVQTHKAAGVATRAPIAPPRAAFATGRSAVIQRVCDHCNNVLCEDGSVCGNLKRKRKYKIGTHGAKKSEQTRLNKKFKSSKVKVTGSLFESEHTVGY